MGQATPNLRQITDRVVSDLLDRHELSSQSERRLTDLIDTFEEWCVKRNLLAIDAVVPSAARAFVESCTTDGTTPSLATRHIRRSALRLLFRTARRLGLCSSDPTLDLALPPRSNLALRPLTDDEIVLCRSCSLTSLTETRYAAAWALAEASATTSEIPAVRASDIDVGSGRVWLAGSSKREPRWGVLTEWGRAQLDRRLRRLGDDEGSSLLIYRGTGSEESRQASSCQAVSATLVRAGLGREPDVRPASVPAWAGNGVFARHGRIEVAAKAMGLRGLDQAARAIAWNWTAEGG